MHHSCIWGNCIIGTSISIYAKYGKWPNLVFFLTIAWKWFQCVILGMENCLAQQEQRPYGWVLIKNKKTPTTFTFRPDKRENETYIKNLYIL